MIDTLDDAVLTSYSDFKPTRGKAEVVVLAVVCYQPSSLSSRLRPPDGPRHV